MVATCACSPPGRIKVHEQLFSVGETNDDDRLCDAPKAPPRHAGEDGARRTDRLATPQLRKFWVVSQFEISAVLYGWSLYVTAAFLRKSRICLVSLWVGYAPIVKKLAK